MTTHSARFYTLIATIYVFNGRKFLSMSYSDILLNWNLVVQQSAVVVPFAKHASGFGLCDKVRQGLFIHALVSGLISTFLPASVISPNRSRVPPPRHQDTRNACHLQVVPVSRQPSILFRWRGGLRAMHGTHFCWLYRGCYALQ